MNSPDGGISVALLEAMVGGFPLAIQSNWPQRSVGHWTIMFYAALLLRKNAKSYWPDVIRKKNVERLAKEFEELIWKKKKNKSS
jgi:hypothetical protein